MRCEQQERASTDLETLFPENLLQVEILRLFYRLNQMLAGRADARAAVLFDPTGTTAQVVATPTVEMKKVNWTSIACELQR